MTVKEFENPIKLSQGELTTISGHTEYDKESDCHRFISFGFMIDIEPQKDPEDFSNLLLVNISPDFKKVRAIQMPGDWDEEKVLAFTTENQDLLKSCVIGFAKESEPQGRCPINLDLL